MDDWLLNPNEKILIKLTNCGPHCYDKVPPQFNYKVKLIYMKPGQWNWSSNLYEMHHFFQNDVVSEISQIEKIYNWK